MGQHGSASGSILLGLARFEVTAAQVSTTNGGWRSQTTAATVGCTPVAPRPGSILAAQCGCGTCRSVAVPWCRPGGNGVALCGAGMCGPDEDRADGRSGLGRC